MSNRLVMSGLTAALLLSAEAASGADDQREGSAPLEFEFGGGAERNLRDGGSGFGPTAAIEVEPIKDWLEIEVGVSPLFGRGATELDSGVALKKPFDLSELVELEVGVGASWAHATGNGKTSDAAGVEIELEIVVWAGPERELGWFVAPAFAYDFGGEHERALGVSAGLKVPFP